VHKSCPSVSLPPVSLSLWFCFLADTAINICQIHFPYSMSKRNHHSDIFDSACVLNSTPPRDATNNKLKWRDEREAVGGWRRTLACFFSLARTETSTHGNDAEPEGHREAHCWLARGWGRGCTSTPPPSPLPTRIHSVEFNWDGSTRAGAGRETEWTEQQADCCCCCEKHQHQGG
jgi:hypothetical protein